MAKAGEGDSRWIVSERTDGQNVGNWHWVEKDQMPWVKSTFATRCKGVPLLDGGDADISIVKSVHVKGEATVNVRKGKTLHLYDLDLKVKFKGSFRGEEAVGTIHMPDVSYGDTSDEWEMNIAITKAVDKGALRTAVKKNGLDVLRGVVAGFLEEYSALQGHIREVKAVELESKGVSAAVPTKLADVPIDVPVKSAPSSSGSSSSRRTKTVDFDFSFRARSQDIWECLLDPRRVAAYTQSPPEMDPKVGGVFSLFNGHIRGMYLSLEPYSKIVMEWRQSNWSGDAVSTVTLTLSDTSSGMTLHVKQVGIPEDEAERTEDAWKQNILQRIKVIFGYGGMM